MKTMFNQGREVQLYEHSSPILQGFAVLAWGHDLGDGARPGVVFKSWDPLMRGMRFAVRPGDRFEVI